MATTYSLVFNFAVSQLKASAKKVYDDGARGDSSVIADVATKFAVALTSATGNAAAGGSDRAIAAVYDIAAAGTTTIDLQAFVDLAERAAQSLARIKFLAVKLLPTAQDGTACSGVEIGNHATTANTLFMKDDTDVAVLENGDFIIWGKGTAGGKVVDATNKSILVTVTDAVVAAKLLVVAIGGSN
jgi:hypothetical protein